MWEEQRDTIDPRLNKKNQSEGTESEGQRERELSGSRSTKIGSKEIATETKSHCVAS